MNEPTTMEERLRYPGPGGVVVEFGNPGATAAT